MLNVRPKLKRQVTCPGAGCNHQWHDQFEDRKLSYVVQKTCPRCGRKLKVEVEGRDYHGLSGHKYEFSKIEAQIIKNFARYQAEYHNQNFNFGDAIHEILIQTNETLREIYPDYAV